MVSIHKVVGVLSCSFLLCLGLSTVASSILAERYGPWMIKTGLYPARR